MRILAAAAILAAGTMQAQTVLNIYVTDSRTTHGLCLYPAETVASRIFAKAGLQVQWHGGNPPASKNPAGLAFGIDLVDQTSNNFKPGALAFAYPFEGVHIRVFYDRIQGAARAGDASAVLGHVIAHEVTHLLEGMNRHSGTGLMKAKWSDDDFFRMRRAPLEFAEDDLDLIQLGIANRRR